MYQASIEEHSFQIEVDPTVSVQGKPKQVKFNAYNGSFQLEMDGKTKEADVVSIDKDAKLVMLRIEGKKYTVQIKESVDLLLEKLGMTSRTQKKFNHLKAPMPGLISKIFVKEGDMVKKGEPLLILEAMKMENVFKASADATVKSIFITEKQGVEKGITLIEFESN
jgi:biotin carboxyl carrier protein